MSNSNDSSLKSAAQRLGSLPAGARLKGFIRAAYFVTMAARDSYEVGTNGLRNPERLRVANELLHRLLGIAAASAEGQSTYPDDVIVEIIHEMAPNAGIDPQEVISRVLVSDVN